MVYGVNKNLVFFGVVRCTPNNFFRKEEEEKNNNKINYTIIYYININIREENNHTCETGDVVFYVIF